MGWGFLDIPGASQVEKGERRRSNDMYALLLLLLPYSMLLVPGMRSDDICLIVALDVKMLLWFICCCAPTTRT